MCVRETSFSSSRDLLVIDLLVICLLAFAFALQSLNFAKNARNAAVSPRLAECTKLTSLDMAGEMI